MDNQQQFVAGFLASCADRGLSPQAAETLADVAVRFPKQAAKLSDWFNAGAYVDSIGKGVKLVKEVVAPVGALGLMAGGAGLGLAATGGYHAGKWLGRAQDKGTDPEDIRVQELVAALHRNARQMNYQRQRMTPRA